MARCGSHEWLEACWSQDQPLTPRDLLGVDELPVGTPEGSVASLDMSQDPRQEKQPRTCPVSVPTPLW